MVRLSELKSTAQSPRPTRPTAALQDSIITQREEAQSATEEEEEEAAELGAEAARKNEGMEPKQKQYSVVDVTGPSPPAPNPSQHQGLLQ